MVINNPDENDYALVKRSYPAYIKDIHWTREVGESGTEHIQAYVKLQRQQRMSFIKKLFPKGHFKSITSDLYNINTMDYATKDDETTAGMHHITHNDPIPSVDSILKQICLAIPEEYFPLWKDRTHPHNEDATTFPEDFAWEEHILHPCIPKIMKQLEKEMVLAKPRCAKILVSPTYTKLKKEFLPEIFLSYIQNADDDEIQGDENTHDVATIPTTGADEEEGYEEGGCTANEGSDASDYEGSQGDSGDEVSDC